MKYRIGIKRNSDGRVHVTSDDEWVYPLRTLEYLWMEGNYGCDCNRHQIFEDVRDSSEEHDHIPCGDTEYSIAWFEIESTRYTPEQLIERISDEQSI